MSDPVTRHYFRHIPSVDEVLSASELADLRARHPGFPWAELVRRVIAGIRAGRPVVASDRPGIKRAVIAAVERETARLGTGGQRRVINATGVVLHTNLGRALIDDAGRHAIDEAAANYVNLEIDLSSGRRGSRADVLCELLQLATGAESALVVNNNAAAVWLAVSSLSPPGRVIVSRGELVEIGGSFRLPDILDRAASEVIEIGTTNRTYIADYAKHARPGDVIMRAHRSNYDIHGFTHETSIAELVGLAKERECYFVYDAGSGALFDYTRAGLPGHETASELIAAGVPCVTMSGDKLLGGVQAGIVLGDAAVLDRLRENPLRRALRVDKLTIAAMQSLMRTYLFDPSVSQAIPTLRQAVVGVDELRSRAENIVAALASHLQKSYDIGVVDDAAALGGGSYATSEVAAVAVAIGCGSEAAANRVIRKLRAATLPVLGRVRATQVRLNLRSVPASQDADLTKVLAEVLVTTNAED